MGRFRLPVSVSGPVAQLAERRAFNPMVVGSLPTRFTKFQNGLVAQLVERWIVYPDVEGSSPFKIAMAHSSSGQDAGFSGRKREFDSPMGYQSRRSQC